MSFKQKFKYLEKQASEQVDAEVLSEAFKAQGILLHFFYNCCLWKIWSYQNSYIIKNTCNVFNLHTKFLVQGSPLSISGNMSFGVELGQ